MSLVNRATTDIRVYECAIIRNIVRATRLKVTEREHGGKGTLLYAHQRTSIAESE